MNTKEERGFLNACQAWNCVKVKEYLDKGVDVNVTDEWGGFRGFALKYVARHDSRENLQLLDVLLACSSINVNNKDDKGMTALMWASDAGSQHVALVAERMSNDEYLHPQHNMTELVYALEKGLDNVALVLASGVKVSDILLMCKIFHVEEEKVRLEAKAQEMIEDATPRKRSKLE